MEHDGTGGGGGVPSGATTPPGLVGNASGSTPGTGITPETPAATLFWKEYLVHWLSSPEAATFIQKAVAQVKDESDGSDRPRHPGDLDRSDESETESFRMPDYGETSSEPGVFSALRADTPVVPASALLPPELMPWGDDQSNTERTLGTSKSSEALLSHPSQQSGSPAQPSNMSQTPNALTTSQTQQSTLLSGSPPSQARSAQDSPTQLHDISLEGAGPESHSPASSDISTSQTSDASGAQSESGTMSPLSPTAEAGLPTISQVSSSESLSARARARARERLLGRSGKTSGKALRGDPSILPEPGLVSAFVQSRQRAFERAKLHRSRNLVAYRRRLMAKGPSGLESDAFRFSAGSDRDLSLRYRGWDVAQGVHALRSKRRRLSMRNHKQHAKQGDADWEIDAEEALFAQYEKAERLRRARAARIGKSIRGFGLNNSSDIDQDDFDYFGFDDFEVGGGSTKRMGSDADPDAILAKPALQTDAEEDLDDTDSDDDDDYSDISTAYESGSSTRPEDEREPGFKLQRGLRRLFNLANLREGFAADALPPLVLPSTNQIDMTKSEAGSSKNLSGRDAFIASLNSMSIEGRVAVVLRAWRYHTRAKRSEDANGDGTSTEINKQDESRESEEDDESVKGLPAEGLLPVTTELFSLSAYVNRALFTKLLRFQEYRAQVSIKRDADGAEHYTYVPSALNGLRAAADKAAESAQLALEQLRENVITESEARSAVAAATQAETEHSSKLLIGPKTLIAAHTEIFRHLDPSARLFYVLLGCPPPLRAVLRGVPPPSAMRAYFFVGHDVSSAYLDHTATESDRIATDAVVRAARVEAAARVNMLYRRWQRRHKASQHVTDTELDMAVLTDNSSSDLIDEALRYELRTFNKEQQCKSVRRSRRISDSTGSDDESDTDLTDTESKGAEPSDDPHDWLCCARHEIWSEANLNSLLRTIPEALWTPFASDAEVELEAEAEARAEAEIASLINVKRQEHQRDTVDLDQMDELNRSQLGISEATVAEIKQKARLAVHQRHVALLSTERPGFTYQSNDISLALPLSLAQKASRVTRLLDATPVALLDAAAGVPVFEPEWLDGMFLRRSDFLTLVTEVLHSHPGLEFLANLPDFQQRYAQTVVARIYYALNPSGDERLRVRDIRRAKLLDRLAELAREEDINKVRAFFSYEHFYVIYCKFWELDLDHDMRLDYDDLLRYEDGSLTERIVSRVFSQAPRKFLGDTSGGIAMSYVDFVVFLISEVDKSSRVSITYWFKCIDLDNDGVVTAAELEYFFEEQRAKIARLTHETMLTSDIVCQITDMISPASRTPVFTLRDFFRSKLSGQVFDILFNLTKFTLAESRDPVRIRELHSSVFQNDWERWSAQTYYLLAGAEQDDDDATNSAAAAAAVANSAASSAGLGDMDGGGGLAGSYALSGADFDVDVGDTDFTLSHGQAGLGSQQHHQQQQQQQSSYRIEDGNEEDVNYSDYNYDVEHDFDIDEVLGRPRMGLGIGMGMMMPHNQGQGQGQAQNQGQNQPLGTNGGTRGGLESDVMGVGYSYGAGSRFGGPSMTGSVDDDMGFDGIGVNMSLGASAASPTSGMNDDNTMRTGGRRH